MLLALDIGNTDTVIGLFKGAALFFYKRVPTIKLKTFLSQKRSAIEKTHTSIVSSVVPVLNAPIRKLLKKNLGFKKVLFVSHRLKLPIALKVDYPKEVGADRIVNNSAAFHSYPKALLVIDFGTATTVDYISRKGEYRGGMIIPGLKTGAQALFSKAKKLPWIQLRASKKILETNTVSQMQSGIVKSYAIMIDALIKNIQKEIHQRPKVILTGGLGFLLSRLIKHPHIFDSFLTLKGLKIIAKMNTQ